MATGKDQPQAVVPEALIFRRLGVIGASDLLLGERFQQGVKSGAPPQAVNTFEPPGRNKPGSGIGGHALLWPLLECFSEGIMQRVLGEIEVAEQTDQRG